MIIERPQQRDAIRGAKVCCQGVSQHVTQVYRKDDKDLAFGQAAQDQREHDGENDGGRNRVGRAMVKPVRVADQYPGHKVEVGCDGGEEHQHWPPARKDLAGFGHPGYCEGEQDVSNRTGHGSGSC